MKKKRVCYNESLQKMNENITCLQTSLSQKKAVWAGEDGSWQHGASTSRWAFVNSRYWVRTGCYQTFKAESIRLLLQRGRKDGVIKDSPDELKVFIRVHWLSMESCASPAGLSPWWYSGESEVSSLHLSSVLCIPQLGFWRKMCSFNAVSKYRVIANHAASILRELMCTS